MRRFFLRFFAAIGLVAILGVIAVVVLAVSFRPKPVLVADGTILEIDLERPVTESASPGQLDRLFGAQQTAFTELLDTLNRASADGRVKGMIARVGDVSMGIAEVQELRDTIRAFRAKGKFAVAFGESFGDLGGGTRSYYLAAAFDEIWLQPLGSLGLTGLRLESPFLKGTLDLVGVRARFDRRKEYKTAMTELTGTKLEEPDRAALQATLGTIYNQIVEGIAEDRHLPPATVKDLMDHAPLLTDQAAESHLIDHIGYEDQAFAAARTRVGANVHVMSGHQYYAVTAPPTGSGTAVAVIRAIGTISKTADNPAIGAADGVGSDAMVKAFRDAVADPAIKAIVLRIDSPGGSETASETIWRETVRAREAGKPIIVTMGDTAASGGYYIAAAADKIVAEPATLTGSIGVFGGKFLLGGLYDKLGVTWDSVEFGRNASISSTIQDFTPEQMKFFESSLDQAYAGFVERVARGRKLSADYAETVAKGRVWSGEEAKANGLVDELGGMDTALNLTRRAIGLPGDAPLDLRPFPRPRSPLEAVFTAIGGQDPDQRLTLLPGLAQAWSILQPLVREIEILNGPQGRVAMQPLEVRD